MSITASVIGLIVYLFRYIKKIPKFAIYSLWSIVLFRLTLPFSIATEYSLMNFISKFATKTVIIYDKTLVPRLPLSGNINDFITNFSNKPLNYFPSPDYTMMNCIMFAESYFPIVYKTNLLENIFNIGSVVWIIGALAAIIAVTLLYIFTKSEIKNAEHIEKNIYQSDKISTPTVYGIIRPKIILPIKINKDNLKYILAHEQVHINRKDNLLRAIAIIISCIYWFNPLIWIFLKIFINDIELSCDAKVLKNLSEKEKKEYAFSLLECANSSRKQTFMASAFGSSKIKVRIDNILSYKKLTIFSLFCTVILFLSIAFVLLTNSAI